MKEISDSNFEQVIKQSTGLIVIEFWAKWCVPCQRVQKSLTEATLLFTNLEVWTMSVDTNPITVEKFQIRTIPHILFYKDGVLIEGVSKNISKKYLFQKIGELI